MDEVDGVTGTDIGGIAELIRIINQTSHPIIITGNDVWQTKLAPLRPLCTLVEMKSLKLDTIQIFLAGICAKEGMRENQHFLRQIAIKSQGDLRAALNDLQAYTIDSDAPIDPEKRNKEESIFNILKTPLSAEAGLSAAV